MAPLAASPLPSRDTTAPLALTVGTATTQRQLPLLGCQALRPMPGVPLPVTWQEAQAVPRQTQAPLAL